MIQQPVSDVFELEHTVVYTKNRKSKANVILNIGGARSSKSYSIAQLIVTKLMTESNKKFLISRKTGPSLNITSKKLILDLLYEYNFIEAFTMNNQTGELKGGANNYLIFSSIDNIEKLKSTEFNYIWLEEANEFSFNDFMILLMRLSGPTDTINQMFLSLNPSDETSWIKQKIPLIQQTLREDPNNPISIETIKSTYLDNPFLQSSYVSLLESVKKFDPGYWQIYGLGEWGKLTNLIYPKYEVMALSQFPEEFDYVLYGADFGFNNESAIAEISIKDQVRYIRERLYERELTNTDLIARYGSAGLSRRIPMFADHEGDRIEEIRRAGYNVMPAIKDVKPGIDWCKRFRVVISDCSVNFLKEISRYTFEISKDGVIGEFPVKIDDHLMDAWRYADYTYHKTAGGVVRGSSVSIC